MGTDLWRYVPDATDHAVAHPMFLYRSIATVVDHTFKTPISGVFVLDFLYFCSFCVSFLTTHRAPKNALCRDGGGGGSPPQGPVLRVLKVPNLLQNPRSWRDPGVCNMQYAAYVCFGDDIACYSSPCGARAEYMQPASRRVHVLGWMRNGPVLRVLTDHCQVTVSSLSVHWK